MTQKQLKNIGFTDGREIRIGSQLVTEMIAVATSNIITTLEENGFSKTWGDEGGIDTYAKFYSDVSGQEFFGKNCISVLAEPTKYNSIIFLQNSDANEALSILEKDGEEAVVNYLAQWDNGDADDVSENPFGSTDTIERVFEYVLAYNSSIGYIGLSKEL